MGELSGAQALSELLSGNLRFLGQQFSAESKSADRRMQVAAGQHPIAVVVGCSDSRVPPEVIFDQGLGDLFVIRQAGHCIGSLSLGSIVYAVEHLHVPLVLVLGHSKCGAVAAALEGHAAQGPLARVLDVIRPAVEQARARGSSLLVDSAVRIHIQRTVAQLKAEPALMPLVGGGVLKIAGAHYDLETGVVALVP